MLACVAASNSDIVLCSFLGLDLDTEGCDLFHDRGIFRIGVRLLSQLGHPLMQGGKPRLGVGARTLLDLRAVGGCWRRSLARAQDFRQIPAGLRNGLNQWLAL